MFCRVESISLVLFRKQDAMLYNLSVSKEVALSVVIQEIFLASIRLLRGGSKEILAKQIITAIMIFGEMVPKKYKKMFLQIDLLPMVPSPSSFRPHVTFC